MEQLENCLACGASSRDAKVVYRRIDDALVRCPRCRLLYANPQYTSAELGPLYVQEYYDEKKNLESDYRERDFEKTRPLYQTVVQDLLRRYPRLGAASRAPRVLDYGSGVGFFLHACREVGMAPLGLDFSDVASRYARQRFDLEVRTDPDEALRALPSGEFQLVTAWQVIEHLRRPREALVELVRVLAPGGVLCIGIPNLKCWRHLIERERWFNIQNRTHLAFFDRWNLTETLRQLGMVNLIRPVFWGGRSDFGPVASAAQYLMRWADLGADLRVYAERPGA